eukprot:Blabericola_migrator_1__13018@NODE_870_length_6205_cov_91_425220_g615_i0_p3_GENE_NODE_870_length_6205_cov_91_425220_g615_i0NODE_870_length_6205_cov_91_425220_g615_i0_p3_ORF_typecomplete_len258_score14_08_NODE_870_length_6205_cov_91_425220_g615_i08781651
MGARIRRLGNLHKILLLNRCMPPQKKYGHVEGLLLRTYMKRAGGDLEGEVFPLLLMQSCSGENPNLASPMLYSSSASSSPSHLILEDDTAEAQNNLHKNYPPQKKRPLPRRKFRNRVIKKGSSVVRSGAFLSSRRRIDLKDWPSDVPLPSVSRTPWESSLDGSSTDVGLTASSSKYSNGLNWDYDDLQTVADSSSAEIIRNPNSDVSVLTTTRSTMVCGDRLTTWRREESSPAFFFIAVIFAFICSGLLSIGLTHAD